MRPVPALRKTGPALIAALPVQAGTYPLPALTP